MKPSIEEGFVLEVLGCLVVGAIFGPVFFFAPMLLAVYRELAIVNAALLVALGVSIMSRYRRVLTGPWRSRIFPPTVLGTLVASLTGIVLWRRELLAPPLLILLLVGSLAGGIASCAAEIFKDSVK